MRCFRFITRRRAKRFFVRCTAGIALVYVLSPFISVVFQHHNKKTHINHNVALDLGRLEIGRRDASRASATWHHETHWGAGWTGEFRLNVIPVVELNRYRIWLQIPLWIPLLLFAVPAGWLCRIDRRTRAWECEQCRYDLRGLDSAICPECGTARPALSERTERAA